MSWELHEIDLSKLYWAWASRGGGLESMLNPDTKPDEIEKMRLLACGIAIGMRWKLPHGKQKDENTLVGKILKSAEVVRLLQRTPNVSTEEICRALDRKGITLPWSELRKQGTWERCATRPKVKMTISRARQAAKQLAKDERYLRLINAGIRFRPGPENVIQEAKCYCADQS